MDNSGVRKVSEKDVLENLEDRYMSGNVYMESGMILLCFNPYTKLAIYSKDAMKAYYKTHNEVEPHIYMLGERAIQNMNIKGNQSIIVSGESGSGKTVNTGHLLEYIISRSNGSERLEKLLISANYILECFGNSQTQINKNSSRFGKLLTLFFKNEKIIGGRISEFLVESNRVTHQTDGNKNFHIFYMVCSHLKIEIVNDYIDTRESFVDPKSFQQLVECFKNFDIEMTNKLCNVLLAVLQIGSIKFLEENNSLKVVHCESFKEVCKTLEINEDQLEKLLLTDKFSYRTEVTKTYNSVEKAKKLRDSFARHIYSNIFKMLIEFINRNLGEETLISISILDIFGFEVFKENDFEQFCINWANEGIHKEYIKALFTGRKVFYEKEGVPFPSGDLISNDSILDLIERKCGIADLIDEESFSPCGSIESLIVKIAKFNKDDYHFLPTKDKNGLRIDHFAYPVTYMTTHFLDKNTEANFDIKLNIDIGLGLPVTSIKIDKKDASFIRYFKESMKKLIGLINKTEVHFVRCIRPNKEEIAWGFDKEHVKMQIRSCGLVEAIRLAQTTFPHIISHKIFESRYINITAPPISKSFIKGTGSYFMRNAVFDHLESLRDIKVNETTSRLKYYCSGMKERRNNISNTENALIEERPFVFCDHSASITEIRDIEKDTNIDDELKLGNIDHLIHDKFIFEDTIKLKITLAKQAAAIMNLTARFYENQINREVEIESFNLLESEGHLKLFEHAIQVFSVYFPRPNRKNTTNTEIFSLANMMILIFRKLEEHEIANRIELVKQFISVFDLRFNCEDLYRTLFFLSNFIELQRILTNHEERKLLDEPILQLYYGYISLQNDILSSYLPDSILYYVSERTPDVLDYDLGRCNYNTYLDGVSSTSFQERTPSVYELSVQIKYFMSIADHYMIPKLYNDLATEEILKKIDATCFNRIIVERLEITAIKKIDENVKEFMDFFPEIIKNKEPLSHIKDITKLLITLENKRMEYSEIANFIKSLNAFQIHTIASKFGKNTISNMVDIDTNMELFVQESLKSLPMNIENSKSNFEIPAFIPRQYLDVFFE